MPLTTSPTSLPGRVQQIIQNASRPLSTREVTEQVYPQPGGATPVRISNIRRILQDLMHDGLLDRIALPDPRGREQDAWQASGG